MRFVKCSDAPSRWMLVGAALLSISFLACSGGGLERDPVLTRLIDTPGPAGAQEAKYVTNAMFQCNPASTCSAFGGTQCAAAATCTNVSGADFCPLQNAVKWSAFYGAELLMPAGACNIGTNTLNLVTFPILPPPNGTFQSGPRIRGTTTQTESIGSVIVYEGTGVALQTGTPTQYDFTVNGHLTNLGIEYTKPAPNGIGLDLKHINQWYFDNVAIQGGPYNQTTDTRDLGIGIRCVGCAIAWFNNTTLAGQADTTTPLVPGRTSFVNKGFLFTNDAAGGGGAVFVRNTMMFLVRRGFSFSSSTAQDFVSPEMVIENTHFDSVGTDFYFDNANPMRLDGLVMRGNFFAQFGISDPENAVIAIDHTVGTSKIQIEGVFEESAGNCFGGQCQQTHATSNIARTGSTVTVNIPDPCVFFEGPVAGRPAGTPSNPYPGTKVYKTGNGDPNFPGGMKTITALKPDGCNFVDPVYGVNCQQPNPCRAFTYTEPVDCSGTGVCGPGCPGTCPSSQSAQFSTGDYFIKEVGNDAAKNSGSGIRLVVRNNEMEYWSYGAYMNYSTNSQTTCGPGTCNDTTIQLERNRLNNPADTGFLPRNINSIWGAGSAGGVCAMTPAGQYTGAELASCLREVFISNTPANNPQAVFPTLSHWAHRARHVLNGSGTFNAPVPDYQDFCVCRDITTPTNSCTADPPVSTGESYPNFQGTTLLHGTPSDTVDLDCW